MSTSDLQNTPQDNRDSSLPQSDENIPKRNHLPNAFMRLYERFGFLDTIVLPLGTIAIIITLGVLTALWEFGNRNTVDQRSGYWSTWVVSGWGARVVTVSSAMLRVCVFAQTLTCCFMMASLAIDYNQANKGNDLNLMTVYTQGNSGPNNILYLLLKGKSFKTQPFGLAVVALMALSVVASQLFSTVLISDLENVVLRGKNETIPVKYNQFNISTSSLTIPPSEFPVFAEESVLNAPLRGQNGYFDSGVVRRAFFPFGPDKRQSIGSYRGSASVAKLHYLCFPPELRDVNVNASDSTVTGTLRIPSHVLDDTAKYSHQLKSGYFDVSIYARWMDWKFNCTIQFNTITTCVVPASWMMLNTLNPYFNGVFPDCWNLVIDIHFPGAEGQTGTELNGEWAITTFNYSHNLYLPLKYSLCAGKSESAILNVFAEAVRKVTEPRMLGQGLEMNTTKIQQQLGVDAGNLDEKRQSIREIFNLKVYSSRDNETGLFNPGSYWNVLEWCIPHVEHTGLPNYTRGCNSGSSGNNLMGSTLGGPAIDGGQKEIHAVYQAIFRNALQDTGSLVLSIQAVQSLLYASAYYQNLYTYDMSENAFIRNFTSGLAPVQWRGFATVTSFVVLHFTLMTLIISVYIRSESFAKLQPRICIYESVDEEDEDNCESIDSGSTAKSTLRSRSTLLRKDKVNVSHEGEASSSTYRIILWQEAKRRTLVLWVFFGNSVNEIFGFFLYAIDEQSNPNPTILESPRTNTYGEFTGFSDKKTCMHSGCTVEVHGCSS
ncbi:hypothetical protein K440DRAFT_664464 [Wilcoxina mikolae CBS 423.85]|nr:hypothetical protein K440DRAFT_664464 [Wilcoxina mikolae CBS 423.85]